MNQQRITCQRMNLQVVGARLILGMVVALGAAVSLSACSSGKKTSQSGKTDAQSLLQQSPRERVASRAAAERTAQASLHSRDVPVPLGVDPVILEARDPSDRRARMNLDEALRDISRSAGDVAAPAPPPVSEESKAEALKFYAKGREAAMDNRHLVAVTEFLKAQELDPNSPQITRELARSYLKVGNSAKAAELFEQLARLDPADSEALFTVGLALANRREFQRAAEVLGRMRASADKSKLDPVAHVLADFTLAMALRELGYDQASIESGLSSLELPANLTSSTDHALRLGSVYRQRGDTWRAIGDAYCRLGEYAKALDAYEMCQSMPSADPAALHPRVVFANLKLGRTYSAQDELLKVLEDSETNVSDRDIRLCGYVAEHAQPDDDFSAAVVQMYRSRPDDDALARAAASVLPADESLAVLREFVQRRPRDTQAVRQLLAWLAQRDLSAAVALTVALTTDHPDLGEEYGRALSIAVPRVYEAAAACEQLPPSPALALVHARLLASSTAMGKAWFVCEEARKRWPDDPGLRVMQIRLAAALEEPALLEQLASQSDDFDLAGIIAVAQAHRSLGQHDKAVEAAKLAEQRDPQSFDALVELGRAYVARAGALAADRVDKSVARSDCDSAEQFANRAVDIDPSSDEPYEVLVAVFGPGGPLADSTRFRQIVQSLYAANPNSPLHARLLAQEAIGQRRYDQAIERLANLCENDPADIQSLRLAVIAWERWNRLDVAEEWLARRLEARPGDAALLEQWVYVMLKQDKAAQVLAQLETDHQSHPDDYAVARLLEQVYRATGRSNEALALGVARLEARPEGMRRELELAELYIGAQRWNSAAKTLQWVRDHAEQATIQQLETAASLASRLEDDPERRDALTLQIVERAIALTTSAPLDLYGMGLRALARMGRLGDEFQSLADHAARHAHNATDATPEQLAPWVRVAQALVQDDQPQAAGLTLRARMHSTYKPLPDDLAVAVSTVAFAADAASPNMAQQSIELARELDRRGVLRSLSTTEQPVNLGQMVFDVSSMYTLVGNRDGAATLLRKTIELLPDHAMAMNNLGYARIVAGHDDEETAQLIERAWELMPADPNILDTVGWLRYLQGRFGQAAKDVPNAQGGAEARGAAELIQAAIDANAAERGAIPSPEVLDHLGDVLWRLGDTDGAARSWRKAVTILEDRSFEERVVQNYLMQQTRVWQLLVADPREMYDREFGQIRRRAEAKIQAVEQGREPAVAPTFDEQNAGLGQQ